MPEHAKTTIGPLPSGLVSGSRDDTSRLRRKPGKRRFVAAFCLTLLAGSLAGGSYYLLSRVEPETGEEDVRTELAPFAEHDSAVLCAAVAADGETVVSGDKSGQVLIWNGATRTVRSELVGHTAPVGCLALSPDAKLAATGDDEGTVRVWDAQRGKQTAEFFAHGGGVSSVALYPTQQYLVTCGRDGRLGLWNLSEPSLVREFQLTSGRFNDVALTPDGLQIVAGDSGGALRLFNLTEFAELKRIEAHSGGVMRLAVSPLGGEVLTAGKDGVVRRWDLQSGRLQGEWKPQEAQRIGNLAYSPGGTRALVAGQGGKIIIWSTEDDRVVETVGGAQSPSSCGQFFSGGTLVVGGAPDRLVRYFRIPAPTAVEIESIREVAESNTLLARKFENFAEHMKLGQSILQRRREKEALAEFKLAEAGVPQESLEYQAAHAVVVKLANNIEVLERYASLCKGGKQAADAEDFAGAIVRFEEAQKLVRSIGLEAKYPEAGDGVRAARRAQTLADVLRGVAVVERHVDFGSYVTKRPLDRGRKFAFLLTKEPPPMALADSQLEWYVKLTTPEPFPEEEVSLRVELYRKGVPKPLAAFDHPFVAGETAHEFLHRVTAPSGGWASGTYEIRSVLLTPKGKLKPQSQEFKLGRLDWDETRLSLAPEAVQRTHYVVESGVAVKRGEALHVSAVGTTTPAPTAFYRELLGDLRIAAPVPAGPEGIAWSRQAMRLQKYRTVDTKSDYAALLMRIGYESVWLPYKRGVPPLVMPIDGPLQLSINSVIPYSFSYAKPPTEWSVADKQYWSATGGAYDLTILHGRFDFPAPLSELDKAGLLLRYFAEIDPDAKSRTEPVSEKTLR